LKTPRVKKKKGQYATHVEEKLKGSNIQGKGTKRGGQAADQKAFLQSFPERKKGQNGQEDNRVRRRDGKQPGKREVPTKQRELKGGMLTLAC